MTVDDTLNDNLVYVSATAVPAATPTVSGQIIRFTGQNIAQGASVTYTIRVRVKDNALANTTIANVVSAIDPADPQNPSTGIDPNPPTVAGADLQSIKMNHAGSSVKPGQEYSYSIIVNNVGGGGAAGVTITDAVNSNLIVLGAAGGTVSGQDVSWTNQTIPAGTARPIPSPLRCGIRLRQVRSFPTSPL